MSYAVKSIKQRYHPTQETLSMMMIFREMVNKAIAIGLENGTSNMKRLSLLSYNKLAQYDIPSYYKLNAISQAAARLAHMKQDIRKGRMVKSPLVRKPYITTCYGFKVNGMLLSIPARREHILVPLNNHTVSRLSEEGIQTRSFTVTPQSISISIRKVVQEIMPKSVIGIDRNLRNVTISTSEGTVMYRTEKMLSIKENMQHVRSAFRRNDRRVKTNFFMQQSNRQSRRIQQYLHKISKDIVQKAKETRSAIVLEDIKGIRRLYRKGNGQGNKFRRRLNSWSFYELQRQIQYKAAWGGIPVQFVDPRCTSKLCPICGHRVQEDGQNRRKLLCNNCGRSMDRDVVASMNIAHKGWSRFCHPRGLPDEAMKGNADNLQPLILRVDGSKLVMISDGMKN
ncbi:MAG: transposase [Thaumarchaeota archaeon]|nr:transposase [Nitrososphaerota archaeon]